MSRGRVAEHLAPQPGRSSKEQLLQAAPLLVLLLGLAAWTALSIHLARRLWFFGDDFDFLLNRTASLGGERGLFVPHNEHWSTVPILLYRLGFHLFGLHHYLPYALLPIACHLLVTLLVFVALRRHDVSPWIAAFTALLVLFIAGSAGAENILWAFQVGFLTSCTFGLVAIVALASEIGPGRGRLLAVIALVVALMSSGMGLVMVVWTGSYLLLRSGIRASAQTIAVPMLVALGWYVAVGHGHPGAPDPDRSVALAATSKGISHIWSGVVQVPNAGPVIMLVLVVAAFGIRGREPLFGLAASGLVAVVLAYALFGYTRSGFGVDGASASRYSYFGVVFCAGSVAAALEIVVGAVRRWRLIPLLMWVAGVTTIALVGSTQLTQFADGRWPAIRENEPRLIAATQLIGRGGHILRPDAVPIFNSGLTAASLAKPSARAAVPSARPTHLAELDVETNMLVDVNPSSFRFSPPARYAWVRDGTAASADARSSAKGCTVHHAASMESLDLEVGAMPAQVRLVVSGVEINVSLSSGGVESAAVPWPTTPGQPFHVATTALDRTLRIAVPAGDVTVCFGEPRRAEPR